ncbi:transport protein (probable substrate phosphate/sulfate) [Natronomonas pharaonis DSM 2160]|uniref:Phosphate transporter n=1 Tax=Natronomonas pharaonis (strain ATCC 35678 / DSM 2160 / CIP 103997 / JCM 8858 / NBRC 14720 / NCIMB 2260 / Gabara) TaxID=348780 RepID=A0A1U7EUX1_NATPD|nr:inorganic phosphate transporter [Natronomonas pharaonis]CAI48797.1 transport protein (probable substrate phosphate/sulfate) [Natronomonas pharaonis DSM 2160]
MDPLTVVTFVVAGVASLFMAWAIGAGSSGSTPFAPAVGANAISVMRAGFFVGILGLLGATLQGANVTEAVGRELVVGTTLPPIAAILALFIAAALVAVGVFAGYPIATAFTVTGAVVGAGLAVGGDPAWAKYYEILAVWTLTPFVGGGVAYATARLLRQEWLPDVAAIAALAALVGAILANVEFVLLGPADTAQSVSQTIATTGLGVVGVTLFIAAVAAALMGADVRRDAAAGQRHFLIALGALVAFSAGGSQVGLALGPLLPLLDASEVAIPLVALLFGGGLGLLVGSWTAAPRMIKAISQDYSSLGPRRSIAALIPSFIIAQVAILLGVPISFNEIIVSAVVGAGAAAESGGVSRGKMLYTVLAWIGSLVGAGVLSFGLTAVATSL